MPTVVARGDRVQLGGDGEVMGPVVLDQERAVGADDVEHLPAQVRRPLRAGRVGEGGLGVERPGPGLLERAGQVLGVGLGIEPGSEVEFELDANGARLVRRSSGGGRALVAQMRGRASTRMSTDEIMALTRGED